MIDRRMDAGQTLWSAGRGRGDAGRQEGLLHRSKETHHESFFLRGTASGDSDAGNPACTSRGSSGSAGLWQVAIRRANHLPRAGLYEVPLYLSRLHQRLPAPSVLVLRLSAERSWLESRLDAVM